MISFKEFLSEQWRLESSTSKIHGHKTFATHEATIDGHEVRLDINGNDKKDFSVNYTVNGDYNKRKIDPSSGRKILHHIHKKVGAFVRVVRPNSISLSSPHERNIALHDSLTKKLTRKYGGTVTVRHPEHIETVTHTVTFSK